MIECYTWTTDNGYKPLIMLEETALPYKLIPVNIREKAQMKPEFMTLSPGHKIPAIVDNDGPSGQRVTLCESGAILKYLAEKSGKLYPSDPAARSKSINGCSMVLRPSQHSRSNSVTGRCGLRSRRRRRKSFTRPICATCSASSIVISRRMIISVAITRSPISRCIPMCICTASTISPERLYSFEALARCDRGAASGAARLEAVYGLRTKRGKAMSGAFSGKVAVITGGSRGIGREIAVEFARAGAQTVIVSSSPANLAAASKTVAAAGGPAPLALEADLRTLDGCQSAFETVKAKFQRCDILVCSAGATRAGNFVDLPDDAWIDGYALKFFGCVRMCRLFWPMLKSRARLCRQYRRRRRAVARRGLFDRCFGQCGNG